MTIKIIDAVFETTTTTGAGDVILAGALAGFRPLSSAGNNAYVAYQINDGNAAGVVTQREIGIGQIIISGGTVTLKRLKILYSTNSNQAVNFGAGTKNVLGSIPADILAVRDENLNFLEGFGTGGGTATAHTVSLPVVPLAYSDGMRVYYYVTITNTGAFTVNVNTLGNKSVKYGGADPTPGLVPAGSLLTLVYNGSTGFFDIQPTSAMVATGPVGQCRLVRSGANLVLQPFNGNRLTINGLPQLIPSSLSLAPTGLATGTVYYIYAYMNAGIMALEASTTGHGTDAATGVEIKTGDASRTLVGMGYTAAAAIWGTGAADVASWFNRRLVTVYGAFGANRTTASTILSELNSEIRANFLSWGDSGSANYSGAQSHSAANGTTFSVIELDGTSIISSGVGSAAAGYVNGSSGNPFTASEGRHYVTLFVNVQTAGTGTWYAQSSVAGSGVLSAMVMI